MKKPLVAMAALTAFVVACQAAPLTLERRLLGESDLPGSLPDPLETRQTAASLEEFTAWEHTPAAELDPGKLEEAGFVSAVHDTRFYPETPNGPHTRDAVHVRILVLQLDSQSGARTAADLLHAKAGEPCPFSCVAQIEEFDVSGVPDARGVRRLITAEALEDTGEEGDPSDAYTITFVDGSFAYQVEGFGPPGSISEQQVEDIAKRLHDRVAGAPVVPSPGG